VTDGPDAALLARFVEGDQDAFERLYRQFEVDVFRWIVRIVRDPHAAEDALVEAFWRAYRSRGRFDPSRSFGAWMRRIATNAALDHLRAMRSRAPAEELREESHHGDTGAPDRDTRLIVMEAFRLLPPKLQIVAVLALVEQQPYGEIADALDLPVGTIKSRVFRATRMLRTHLSQRGIHR
jgi:RNA polymerase sigma-70 factor (ECF subfamily)